MAGLQDPVRLALIGAGNRSQTMYRPIIRSLAPWVKLVAVCDPVREHADAFAAEFGVPAFYSLQAMVKARPMEAALVVAPVPVHHACACYLAQHGIHCHTETSMATLLCQAQEMVQVAREHNVLLRVAENFFRFPFDRMMKKIDQTGFLGEVRRITCLHDHTGFHNNSRWIAFWGSYPLATQAVSHSMPVAPYYEQPHRHHTEEGFRCHFFWFPGDKLVTDLAGNIKGCLGRYPRPGYTEVDGARGTIVQSARVNWHGEAEVRYCSDEALLKGGVADHVFPIVHEEADDQWTRSYTDLPIGRVEHVNPYRPAEKVHPIHAYYGGCLMDHVVDFAKAVRAAAPSEYSDEDALMAMMMEVATRESALRGGVRVELPLTGALESEEREREAQRAQYGVDPMDVEGMLAVSYPRP